MKLMILLAGALMFTVSISGCTTRDWIQAVGGAAQARDEYAKKSRIERLKKANAASSRVN